MTTVHHGGDNHSAAGGGWVELRILAEMFEDAQQARIACVSRVERAAVDPTVYKPQLLVLKAAEHEIGLVLGRCYRRVVPPEIRAWEKENVGIGEHLLARLLGVVGHPIHTTVHEWVAGAAGKKRELVVVGTIERRVSDLWSYCGHGDPARRRRSGMTQVEAFALGSPRAKMLTYLLAESCMKRIGQPTVASQPIRQATGINPAQTKACAESSHRPSEQEDSVCAAMHAAKPTKPTLRRSIYRDVYDEARERYADRIHDDECPPCHAKAGDPWRDGHKNGAALRFVGKAILKDLWIAARDGGAA